MLNAVSKYPYVAPAGHPSAWSQELMATAFFRILTGNTESALILASIQDETAALVGVPEPLYTYKRVRVTYLGQRAGYFVMKDNQYSDMHDKNMENFRRRNIGAVLALESADGSIADACLLPLPDVPLDGAELVFIPESSNDARVPLGKVRQLQPDVAIFSADITKLPLSSCLPNASETDPAIDTSGHLLLAGETIYRIDRGSIQPNPVFTMSLRDSSDYYPQIESVTTPHIIEIELQLDDGTVLRRPMLTIHPERTPDIMEIKDPPAVLIDHSFAPTL